YVLHPPILAPIYPRIPLPDMLEETPLYVNAKQYARILKRRQQKAKQDPDNSRLQRPKKVRRLFAITREVLTVFLKVLHARITAQTRHAKSKRNWRKVLERQHQ